MEPTLMLPLIALAGVALSFAYYYGAKKNLLGWAMLAASFLVAASSLLYQ